MADLSSASQAAAAVVAARRGDAVALRRLLAEGCPPDAYDGEGWTPLLVACARGRADIVALLLDNEPAARIDLGHRDSDGLPIHFAGQSGNPAIAELLLDRVPDQLDAVWYVNGHTLLLQAAFYGHRDMVALALGRGANTAATTLRGLGALELAEQFDNRALADLIRPVDATPAAKAAYYRTLLRRILPLHDRMVAVIESGLADSAGNVDIAVATLGTVRDLIENRGADVNALGGPLQQPPLVVAVTGNDGKPPDPVRARLRRDLARLLLEHGADPLRCELHPMAVDSIIRASVFNHLEILALIAERIPARALAEALNRPASVNGLTALHDTVLRATTAAPDARQGYLDQIRWTVAHGARSDIEDFSGRTQREIAGGVTDAELRRVLLDMLSPT
jgi:ankyrin repeat protein